VAKEQSKTAASGLICSLVEAVGKRDIDPLEIGEACAENI
jgi:hypothetical protein